MLVATSGIVVLGSSKTIAGFVVLSVVATIVFVRRERRTADPLIPPVIFTSPCLSRSIIVTGIGGVPLFGIFTLITATCSIVAHKFLCMVPWGRPGLVLGAVGLSLPATLPITKASTSPGVLGMAIAGLALSGAALGLLIRAYTLVGITTAPPEHFGSAMATLARRLRSSIGAAAFGWLANHHARLLRQHRRDSRPGSASARSRGDRTPVPRRTRGRAHMTVKLWSRLIEMQNYPASP